MLVCDTLLGGRYGDRVRFNMRYLLKDTSMEVLVLKDNNIGEDGARHLTRAIMETHRLTELHLGLNLLGDAGHKSAQPYHCDPN
eukprot:1161630-Amphidinium_carterae.1